jgi:hypothetical protein
VVTISFSAAAGAAAPTVADCSSGGVDWLTDSQHSLCVEPDYTGFRTSSEWT